MTFREKLKRERPEYVDDKYVGGCFACPHTYRYEQVRDDFVLCWLGEFICKECWDREIPEEYNREIPETKKENDTMNKEKVFFMACYAINAASYEVVNPEAFRFGKLLDGMSVLDEADCKDILAYMDDDFTDLHGATVPASPIHFLAEVDYRIRRKGGEPFIVGGDR